MNHVLNIEKAVNHHKQVETNEVNEDISQNNPTQGIEIESSEFGVQDIHEEIIDDTQKTTEENIELVSYFNPCFLVICQLYQKNQYIVAW